MDAITAALARTPFTMWDILDVLIVAVVIYESLKLIRGTRTMQMAFGSALIVGLYFASVAAPLQTVNWLIRNMVGYLVFALIVLFQNDIRRALAHVGRTPFLRAFSKAENDDETIEEIVTAAQQLAERKIGALIVIEREIGLRNYVESGIPLDAMVTHDLLVSVFQTSGPLHDGAVIIQENRIAAAACFLPLTVSATVGTDLGTRHRAAIGLTEENDAVAVVVSEETGRMSLAADGQITRGLSAETLRARLNTQVLLRRTGNRRARAVP
jgi:diadenylate cyclase